MGGYKRAKYCMSSATNNINTCRHLFSRLSATVQLNHKLVSAAITLSDLKHSKNDIRLYNRNIIKVKTNHTNSSTTSVIEYAGYIINERPVHRHVLCSNPVALHQIKLITPLKTQNIFTSVEILAPYPNPRCCVSNK